MDPMTASALGQVGGAIAGQMFGNNGDEERQRALELLLNTNVETGDVAPDMRSDQASAVEYLRNLYAQGGMDAQSKAALGEAQASNAARERMGRGAIAQNAATRGVGGSGVEIAAQLANQQGAANRNATAGTAAAGDARTRAIQALRESAGIAGNVRGQDSSLAEFNAAQRLRRAEAAAGLSNAQAANKNDRFDFAQLGGMLGAGLSGLSSKKQDEGWSAPIGTGEAGTDGWGY